MEKELLKGNIAIARAALNCGCNCYFGYPITPQTEIGEYLSSEMQKRGLAYVCAESEIAAINMALGAASTGAKVMTSSSSCAVALMQETLSYAASDELPMVIVNVMRAGPGQGYIFPSQGDYNQATIGGGNGDYKVIVLSPTSVQECVDLTYRAFYLAQYYRNPVMLLVDGQLGQMAEPAVIGENTYDEIDNSSWILTGKKDRDSRNIHSLEPDHKKLAQHTFDLYQKYQHVEQNQALFEEYKCDDADFILVAFGSMARSAKSIADYYRYIGFNYGVFIPKMLSPFPYSKLAEYANRGVMDFYCIEMNLGQMFRDVRLAVGLIPRVSLIARPAGEWLTEKEIIKTIDDIYGGRYATGV